MAAPSREYGIFRDISEQAAVLRQIAEEPAWKRSQLSERIATTDLIWLTGCGSSYRAAMVGSYLISQQGRHRGRAIYAPELTYFTNAVELDHMVLALSRSGETDSLLEAMQQFRNPSIGKYALVNSPHSTLSKIVDDCVLINAGAERSAVCTKTYTAMISYLLAIAVEDGAKFQKTLFSAAQAAEAITKNNVERIASIATTIAHATRIFVFGSGVFYPTALEAVLKLKEIANCHAEGFACGELWHSAATLVEEKTPCIVFVPENGEEKKQALECVKKLKELKAIVLGISKQEHQDFDYHLSVPAEGNAFLLASIIPVHWLSFSLALEKGLDPDNPRNLVRSVTK